MKAVDEVNRPELLVERSWLKDGITCLKILVSRREQ